MGIDREAGTRRKVRAAFPPEAHLTWVESHLTSQGVPDLNYQHGGVHEWLELKFAGKTDKEVTIRPAQYGWFRERLKAGGRPFLLVEIEGGFFFLVNGVDVVEPTALKLVVDVMNRACLMTTDMPCVIQHITELATSA